MLPDAAGGFLFYHYIILRALFKIFHEKTKRTFQLPLKNPCYCLHGSIP
ncbi:hypothetical protein CLOSYM_04669 [[Clostridium] symbiosum ATCC 14940]|uniref:Uncharacterized protein n=1 Tax=[Clostridium] symbiosum ATCC 14940 TaxID=411472 RepID=A0ABC9TR19_CLOSY|nr:hypothetical protein CLOSYM_04669 [[Clostridium] symbiosum ATCC 14940]